MNPNRVSVNLFSEENKIWLETQIYDFVDVSM